MSEPADTEPEFSFETDLKSIPRGGRSFSLSAGDEALTKVAKRLGVIAVDRLEGDVLMTASRSEIRLSGVLRGGLTRECVASLEPMAEMIEEEFDITFLRQPEEQVPGNLAEVQSVDSEEEGPEIHTGDHFDLGEFLVQQLSLAMDPFPRKPGAESLVETYGRGADISPFAALREKIEKSDENQ